MTATLTFDLSSPDDRAQHTLAVAAPSLYAALCEHDLTLRNRLKYGELRGKARQEVQSVRDDLYATMEKYRVATDMVE